MRARTRHRATLCGEPPLACVPPRYFRCRRYAAQRSATQRTQQQSDTNFLFFILNIKKGASKRGWATWLHAAVDERVTVAIPIVIPLLNTKENMLNEWVNLGTLLKNILVIFIRFYLFFLTKITNKGEWGWALDDYTAQHVFDFAGTPQFDLLMSHVDPLFYNDRYKKNIKKKERKEKEKKRKGKKLTDRIDLLTCKNSLWIRL